MRIAYQTASRRVECRIERVEAAAYVIPTDAPEADGTLDWDSTTLITVNVSSGDMRGFGYTYADRAAATLVNTALAAVVTGQDAMNVEAAYAAMNRAVRNLGRQGVAATAISAVDVALWDLKARLLDVPLVSLLGAARDAVPVYGSGGFTSYSDERLQIQLGGWIAEGIGAVKMKIGRDAAADRH